MPWFYRVERTKEATPANAPILYQYGAFGKRLGKYDQVDQLFRHRRATVSLGYIGLYEVATCLLWSKLGTQFRSQTIHDRYHQGYESACGRMV